MVPNLQHLKPDAFRLPFAIAKLKKHMNGTTRPFDLRFCWFSDRIYVRESDVREGMGLPASYSTGDKAHSLPELSQ